MDSVLTVYDKLKKAIRERESQISETLMSGSLENIEHYKFLQGELSALYYIEQVMKDFHRDA
tara:strand:- start:570 stop:755 length:186 start_codon:yes stop_codon:yes gene_type:complete